MATTMPATANALVSITVPNVVEVRDKMEIMTLLKAGEAEESMIVRIKLVTIKEINITIINSNMDKIERQ